MTQSMDEQNDDLDSTASTDEAVSETSSPTVDTAAILSYLDSVERNIASIRQLLTGASAGVRHRAIPVGAAIEQDGLRIIEGTFDGQNMVGPDGKQYSVPANYASKSKLVEGDVLKLTITRDGSFIYKQIGPVERRRIIGQLIRDENNGEYRVNADSKSYKVLLASITYFKGEPGDDVVILLPIDKESRWAAVENIIKQGQPAPDLDA